MDEKFDERKAHLQILFTELNNLVGYMNNRKYYNLNTVGNLIFHFNEIKNETDKNWVYETLVGYMKRCSEHVPSINSKISNQLWNDYIDKIAVYYVDNLNFTQLLNRTFVYVIYLIVLCICYIFLNLYVVFIVAFLFIMQIIRIYDKYRKRRVFGIFW